MHAHGIDIFHVTNNDTVIRLVAHNFVFNFFPAGYREFNENLMNRAKLDAARSNHEQFIFIVSNTAARTAQSIGRPHDNGIPDGVGKIDGFLNIFKNIAFRNRLIDIIHSLFE